MPSKHRTLEESIQQILIDCKTPRTLHFIKDRYNFSHKKLTSVLSDLELMGVIVIKTDPRDGRGTKQISTTEIGRKFLASRAIGVN